MIKTAYNRLYGRTKEVVQANSMDIPDWKTNAPLGGRLNESDFTRVSAAFQEAAKAARLLEELAGTIHYPKGTEAAPRLGYRLTLTEKNMAIASPLLLLIFFYVIQLVLPADTAHLIRQFVTLGQ